MMGPDIQHIQKVSMLLDMSVEVSKQNTFY
jgi:hypothetical protein